MNVRLWFSTHQGAEHAGCHVDTIRKACESGELHGSQRKPGGRWRIHVSCLDAWVGGQQCSHQAAAA